MNLNRIALFVRVVDAGSFSAAARGLGVPTSSVSRGISRLEEELDVRLLQRSTRRLSPTEAGRAYYESVRGALGALEDASAALTERSREAHGTVRLTAPADFGGGYFMRLVSRFLADHPRISIDAVLTNRRVDLIEEGIDLAIRAGRLDDSALMGRRIGDTELGLFASPRYLAARGTPRTLAQLARHDCILFRAGAGAARWRLSGPRGDEEVKVTGRLSVDALTAVREAVVAGLGIGLLPTSQLPGEPDAEPVVRLLPRHAVRGGTVSILWASSRFLPRHVALLRDFLVAELSAFMGVTGPRGA